MTKKNQLNVYLVGGAVRDQLLDRKVIERDYVVVGSSITQMLALGFTQVGKDFPVFLHPKTKEEYALARTEKKQGHGYTGFICDASNEITLEEDLLRRDLTVNAMALANDGTIIDPYNGKADLQNRILRHVSPAFSEDPLRVLRVARFAARYKYLSFSIANETMSLMTSISQSGELTSLSAERIWKEMESAFTEKSPEVFFQTLKECKALNALWPDLANLWDVEIPSNKVSYGKHTMRTLQQAVKLTNKVNIRFAVLCHLLSPIPENSNKCDLAESVQLVDNICQLLKVPNQIKTLALKVRRWYLQIEYVFELDDNTILSMFNTLDVWRKPQEFSDLLVACQAIAVPLTKEVKHNYPQAEYLSSLAKLCRSVNARAYVNKGLKGPTIKQAMEDERLRKIDYFRANYASAMK